MTTGAALLSCQNPRLIALQPQPLHCARVVLDMRQHLFVHKVVVILMYMVSIVALSLGMSQRTFNHSISCAVRRSALTSFAWMGTRVKRTMESQFEPGLLAGGCTMCQSIARQDMRSERTETETTLSALSMRMPK